MATGGETCPACRANTLSRALVRGYPHAKCGRCGLRWLIDPPEGDDLARLYATGFYSGAARGRSAAAILHTINNTVRLRALSGITPGRLLDVGCGKGRFLSAARDAGWHVTGVEFSEAAASFARNAYGLRVVVGDYLTTPLERGYDAITIWHTLEHFPDPGAAIERAREQLRPGGRLVVSVPNSRSLQARLGGDAWFHLDLPRHFFQFTPRSLVALLESRGLAVDHIDSFYPEMEVLGLVQTALSRSGFGQDELYSFIKRDPSVGFGPRIGASAALALLLSPAAVAWSLLAGPLGTGASIQVHAHRR